MAHEHRVMLERARRRRRTQPPWLATPHIAGTTEAFDVRVLGGEVTVAIWSPGQGTLPLLIAHDGPDYDALAGLTRYCGAMVRRGTLAPFRVALLAARDRDEWYSASAYYARALCDRILPALGECVPVAGRPVGMGASLGALAMLHAQRLRPGIFGALFLQSGSFFVPRFDRHESGFRRYGRIVRYVRGVLRAGPCAEPVPVVMTCGAREENLHNNRLMASALEAQGYAVDLYEVSGRHDFTGWRDALHPYLAQLLGMTWLKIGDG